MNKSELIEKLKTYDELILLELLDISSEDIIDAFLEKINERYEYIFAQVYEKE